MTRFAVDLDGTLAQTVEAVLRRLNAEWGSTYTKDHVTRWDFWEVFSELEGKSPTAKKNKVFNTMRAVWATDEVEPEPGAALMMRQLREHGKVDVVTSTVGGKEAARMWLERHRIPHSRLVWIHGGISKAMLKDYDVFVDDKPGLADQMPPDKILLLVDQPWNRDVPDAANVKRIHRLEQAIPARAKQQMLFRRPLQVRVRSYRRRR